MSSNVMFSNNMIEDGEKMGATKVKLVKPQVYLSGKKEKQKARRSMVIVVGTLILIFIAFLAPFFIESAKDQRKWRDFLQEVKDTAHVRIDNNNLILDSIDTDIFLKEIMQGPNFISTDYTDRNAQIFFTVYTDKKAKEFVIMARNNSDDFNLFYAASSTERGRGMSNFHSEWMSRFLEQHQLLNGHE